MQNLISNAAQAMPDGGPLHISTTDKDNCICFTICDSGMGIPIDDNKNIFEPLFTSKSKGVGLGLTIVRNFVEQHHGNIEFDSEVGKGTTFVVRLPIDPEMAH